MDMNKDEQQLDAVRFAAGVAVLMACLEVSFFERWRVLVFIALNLLLLAILFTSSKYQTCRPSSITSTIEAVVLGSICDEKEETSTEEMEMQQCISSLDSEKTSNHQDASEMVIQKGDFEESDEEEDDNKKSISGLSKEELNEKVDAFIAMFRQQYLVSDQPKFIRRRKINSFRLPAHHVITVPPHISSA